MECVFCKSSDVVCNGKRKRKVRVKQSYFCNCCKRQFVEVDGFERMRYKPEVIVRAVHMHEDGMSLSKIQNHLWQHDGVKVSMWAVSQWVKKYSVFLKQSNVRSKTGYPRKDSHG